MRQLDMADAMFVYAEQPARNTQHIGMIFVFDPSGAPRRPSLTRRYSSSTAPHAACAQLP